MDVRTLAQPMTAAGSPIGPVLVVDPSGSAGIGLCAAPTPLGAVTADDGAPVGGTTQVLTTAIVREARGSRR